MFRFVVLHMTAVAAAVGQTDESVLLQTKSMVFEHSDKTLKHTDNKAPASGCTCTARFPICGGDNYCYKDNVSAAALSETPSDHDWQTCYGECTASNSAGSLTPEAIRYTQMAGHCADWSSKMHQCNYNIITDSECAAVCTADVMCHAYELNNEYDGACCLATYADTIIDRDPKSALQCMVKATLRLVGSGSTAASGRLEIYHDGSWGTVCNDMFGTREARVVCRQLGLYGGAGVNLDDFGNRFGEGTGQIWMVKVNCTGRETDLSSCQHAGWGITNCPHWEDVGIECEAAPPTPAPTPPGLTCTTLVNVAADKHAYLTEWNEWCLRIPEGATMMRLTMGLWVDYFKPTTGSLCGMLTANNRHMWSSDAVTWRTPEYIQNTHKVLGGSENYWPTDGRQTLSFWGIGITDVTGGCCALDGSGDVDMFMPFEMSYCSEEATAEEDTTVEVTGDPHMRNLDGEVFDLSRAGQHVLIQIPLGSGEKLEVIGTVTAFHKQRKCPKYFMTELKMKGSMVGEEVIQIVSDREHFGVKLGAAAEFLNIDLTNYTTAGVAQVQRCNEDNALCRSTGPGRRTPNYANRLLVQLPSSIKIVASNYASANPPFMNLAVSGLAAQDDVGGLLGHDDHSMVAGEPECDTSSRVQKISMLQREHTATVGHLTL